MANSEKYTKAEFRTAFTALTVDLLRARAKNAGLMGYSKMRKAELVNLLADEAIVQQAFEAKPAPKTSPLSACEHGTAPQNFCQGCNDTKPAYAAQADKIRAMRERVLAPLHAEAIEMDERRTIARAHLSTPSGVVLTWDEIDAAYASYRADDEMIERETAKQQAEMREAQASGATCGGTYRSTHSGESLGPCQRPAEHRAECRDADGSAFYADENTKRPVSKADAPKVNQRFRCVVGPWSGEDLMITSVAHGAKMAYYRIVAASEHNVDRTGLTGCLPFALIASDYERVTR